MNQMDAPPSFISDKLYSASQKERILADWNRFIENGFQQQFFTRALYKHLHLHCDLPDNGDMDAFWRNYFAGEVELLQRLINQFGSSGLNAIHHNHDWLYSAPRDLKEAMCAVMTPLAPVFNLVLTNANSQHILMAQMWQQLAAAAQIPLDPLVPTYLVGHNTHQLLAYAIRSTPRPKLHGLQTMLFTQTEMTPHD